MITPEMLKESFEGCAKWAGKEKDYEAAAKQGPHMIIHLERSLQILHAMAALMAGEYNVPPQINLNPQDDGERMHILITCQDTKITFDKYAQIREPLSQFIDDMRLHLDGRDTDIIPGNGLTLWSIHTTVVDFERILLDMIQNHCPTNAYAVQHLKSAGHLAERLQQPQARLN